MEEEKRRLRHMLGMDSDSPGYRNYYCCPGDDPVMLDMLEKGLVTWRKTSGDGAFPHGGVWRATPEGRELVEAPPLHPAGGE